MEVFHGFDRCFFAVRMAIGLEMRLGRAPTAPVERVERERAEALERPERPDCETERDRERDREPVSLSVFLRTLNKIVDDASALPGPPPADLPTRRELLARVTSEPGPVSRATGPPRR